jgi:hypothetical protein
VAGSNPINNHGYFTAIDLATPTATPTSIKIGNGVNQRWIRNINGVYWVASLGCGESCVSLVFNPTTATPTTILLPNANGSATPNGDATGISLMVNSGDVYTIENKKLYIYDQSGNPVLCDGAQCPITGVNTGWDVLYID